MVAVILDLEKKAEKEAETEKEQVEKKAIEAEGIEIAYVHTTTDSEKRPIKEVDEGNENGKKQTVDADETETEYVSSLPQLNSFLFCFSLRTGTLIIGWTCAVISFVLAAICFNAYMHFLAVEIDETDDDVKLGASIKMRILALLSVMVVSSAAVSARLLVGVYIRKAAMLKPFMVMLCIYLTMETFAWLAGMKTDATLVHIGLNQCASNCQYRVNLSDYISYLSFVRRLLIGVYMFMVVNSYHTKLQSQSVGYKCMV